MLTHLKIACVVAVISTASLAEGLDETFSKSDFDKILTSLETAKSEEFFPSFPEVEEDSSKDGSIEKSAVSVSSFTPWNGVEIEKVSVVENGAKVEKFWKELKPDQWRQELQDQFTQTIVYDVKAGASVQLPAGTAFSIGRGDFRLSYHNFRYKSYPCDDSNPFIGSVLVGIGIRIDIDAKFRNGNFTLGLTNLALTANRDRVNGSIQANTVGLGNSTTLSQVVGAMNGQITYEGLVEASKAYAVANQALEYMVDLTNPKIFGFIDNDKPGECLAALRGS